MGRKGPNKALRKSNRLVHAKMLKTLMSAVSYQIRYSDRKMSKVFYRISLKIDQAQTENAETLRLTEYQWQNLDAALTMHLERQKLYAHS